MNHSVIAPVPFDPPATVKVVLLPLQIAVVPVAPVGAVDEVFTAIFALATRSVEGTLSTWAFTVAVPPDPFEVKVLIASPSACMVNSCGAASVPNVAVQITGNPINADKLTTRIASAFELERKLVVTVEVLPGPVGVVQIGFGEAVVFNCSHLAAAVPRISAAKGPVFTPHQLLSVFMADTTPPPVVIFFPFATPAAVLLMIRLKLILIVPALTTATAAPPNAAPLATLPEKVLLKMLVVAGPGAVPVILRAPPCVPEELPENVQPDIETTPRPA